MQTLLQRTSSNERNVVSCADLNQFSKDRRVLSLRVRYRRTQKDNYSGVLAQRWQWPGSTA